MSWLTLLRPVLMSVLFASTSSCQNPWSAGTKTAGSELAPSAGDKPAAAIWYIGSVESALAKAKAEQKPVFLYWGAVWCPPCNEIKAEVFTKARFAELMQSFVAVYLDGDTEQAQTWSERLSVAGYPTLLLLNAKGEEIMRIMETVNIQEFEVAVASALAAQRPFIETLDLAQNGKASPADWRVLALLSWSEIAGDRLSPAQQLKSQFNLAEKVPAELKLEAAILSARALEGAASAGTDADSAKITAQIRKRSQVYLNRIFASPESEKSARASLLYGVKEIIPWLYPAGKGQSYEGTKTAWLQAAERLGRDLSLSVDNRLWSVYPALVWQHLERPDAPLPEDLQKRVVTAVASADDEAKSPYQRHAVISGAASLLVEVGELSAARQLLTKELQTTKTPWYYQSAYASLERKAGNILAARQWADKARQSVQGRASKLQWIVTDLVLEAKESSVNEARLAELAQEYYDLAFVLDDGFSGRNARRAAMVAEGLKPFREGAALKKIIRRYSNSCRQGKSRDGKKCGEHFAAFVAKD